MTLLSGFELKEFDSASLTGAYQNLGSVLANPAYSVYINNKSNVDVYISTDGSTDDIRVATGKELPLTYFSRHNTLLKGSCIFKKGQQLHIKQVTGAGAGDIIVNILTKR